MFLQRLQQVVEGSPQKTAVQGPDEALSYQELWQQAGRLAAYLQQHTQSGQTIVVHQAKSAEQLTSLLACWWAGCIWAPLDPALPKSRKEAFLGKLSPAIVLGADINQTTPTIAPNYPEQALPPLPKIDLGVPAYIIPSSGSTGQPKAIVVPHGSLVEVLTQQIEELDLDSSSQILDGLSLMFDARISDWGVALLCAGCLHFDPGLRLGDIEQLLSFLEQRKISYADLPPAVLAHCSPLRCPESLKTILIGGEVASPGALEAWRKKVELWISYGPTEATICTSLHKYQGPLPYNPIGKPLRGVEYLIDDGELLIHSCGLACEYLKNRELTEAKFISRQNKRWYRSGDSVRLEADGNYAYLGRIDRQLKIEGQLVEPAEVERSLYLHPQVKRCLVYQDQDNRLGAVVEAENLAARGLKEHLMALLPAYMVPQQLDIYPQLPLGPTGKVDLSALQPTSSIPSATKLSQIMRSVLGVDTLVPEDDFYELGGSSLSALELLVKANAAGYSFSSQDLRPPLSLESLKKRQGEVDQLSVQQISQSIEPLLSRCTPAEALSAGERWLITGATGFLGQSLLRKLLRRNYQLTALVRAESQSQALKRMQKLGFDAFLDSGQLRVIQSHLDQKYLGLDESNYRRLSNSLRGVIHLAAEVNLSKSYPELFPSNVACLLELLNLCLAPDRYFLHISTLAPFVSSDLGPGTYSRASNLGGQTKVYGAYAQSKYAAELLVQRTAQKHSLQAGIARLGLVGPSLKEKRVNHRDLFALSIEGIRQLAKIPQAALTLEVDLTPMEYVVDSLTELLEAKLSGTVHLANPSPLRLSELISAFEERGQAIDRLDTSQWQRLADNLQTPEQTAAYLGLCRALPEQKHLRFRTYDLFQTTGIRFFERNEKNPLSTPAPKEAKELILDYLELFKETL